MTLPSSGTISLNQIHVEAGGSSGSTASINDSDIRVLIGKSSEASMSFNEWYGASREITLTSETLINSQSNRQEVTTSSFISTNGTLIIPEDFWVWSDSTSTAGLIVDTQNATIKNYGKIIGKGGSNNGTDGGDAISITASGVTIINYSGAYIAGGGGGGGQGRNGQGGGGAGGGVGGTPGVLNAAGSNGTGEQAGFGGGAGGGGAGLTFSGAGEGGAGGRILPGSGGAGNGGGGAGGSAGNAGSNGSGGQAGGKAGGGGGWGASGGEGYFDGNPGSPATRPGGAGGKGIEANSNSFTLTNNGTIYGSQS